MLEVLILRRSNLLPIQAGAGTDKDYISITGHNMRTGEMILNSTRNTSSNPASRVVKVIDNSVLQLNKEIPFQSQGDDIFLFKYVDITQYLRSGTLYLSTTIQKINTCSFKLVLDNTDIIPQAGQQILVKYDNKVVFGGSIWSVGKKVLNTENGVSKLLISINSNGYNHIPSRRSIQVDYSTPMTSGQIVQDMIDKYLSSEGITAGTIEDGADWTEYPTDFPDRCISVRQVLDDMANKSGYKWHIDVERKLHFVENDTPELAPRAVNSQADWDFWDVELKQTLDDYRNKQFVKADWDYHFGDAMVNVVEHTDGIVERQLNEGGSGVYGNIYVDDSEDINIKEMTTEAGTTSTTVIISNHGLKYGDMVMSFVTKEKARVSAVLSTNSFLIDPAMSIGPNDTIATYTDANNICQNNLAKYGLVVPQTLTFETDVLDFMPGQKLTVNLPHFGMTANQYYLIESVSLRDNDGKNLMASVQAVQRDASQFNTQQRDIWVDTFLALKGKGRNKQIIQMTEEQFANFSGSANKYLEIIDRVLPVVSPVTTPTLEVLSERLNQVIDVLKDVQLVTEEE